MSSASMRRRPISARGEVPTYARPTRASISRAAGPAHIREAGLRCPHKACSHSVNPNLAYKPSPPISRPVEMTSTLGLHRRHDYASKLARTGRGRGYRPGQIGTQAGNRGPSQILQKRIRQLARDIKDRRGTISKVDEKTKASVTENGQQVKVNVREDSNTQTFRVDDTIRTRFSHIKANSDENIWIRKPSRSTVSEDSQVAFEIKNSGISSTADQSSENERHSTSHQGESEELTDSEVFKPTPPSSPTPQRKTRKVAVFEPPKIEIGDIKPQRFFDENGSTEHENLTHQIVEPLPDKPPARKRSYSPVRNKERAESDLSSSSNTIKEEEEPLSVERSPNPPVQYCSPAQEPDVEPHRLLDENRSKGSEPPVQRRVEPLSQPPARKRSHSPVRNKERAGSDLSSASNTIKEAEPLAVEYPPDLPARYRSHQPLIREPVHLQVDYPPDFPARYKSRRPSQANSDTPDLGLPSRVKSRTPSLAPTGSPSLLGLSPSVGAGRGRSRSVINISSAYRARRSSVFGLGPRTSHEAGFSGGKGLSNSPPQGRRASVADIFRRSRQSRHRRLSLYLQTSGHGKESAIERLKRISKTVKIIAGICLALKSYVKTAETKQWSLIEMHLNLRADMEKTLAFDPIMFSKLRVTRGSEKLRSILSEKPSQRTKEDVDVVLALLRKNKTFADYNRETQIALAKVMEYLRYEPRRIILKEGHRASGFYIILSGTCLVNQRDIDPRNNQTFVRTIDEIHTGDSFGDIELLNDCVRTVSVVCKDECEVLLVDKEDFNVIIREPLEKEREKLIHFCNTQNVFERLPTNLDFRGNHYAISAKKFKPGVVITSDINGSEFFYVVRSGKCRVISEVKEIKVRPPVAKKVTRPPFSNEEWKKDAPLKRSLTTMEAVSHRRKWATEPKLFQKERQKTFFSLSGIKKSLDIADSNDETDPPPSIPRTLFEEGDKLQTKPSTQEPPDKSGLMTTWRRVSMAASAESEKEKRRNPLLYLKPSHLKSTYAEVAVLKEGDVFGIETLVTGGQPETRLSLVSEGADCIVISKKFFVTQATVSTIQQSTKKTIDYPSAEYTLDKIRQARAWTSYKDSLVKDVCNRKIAKASELSR